MGERCTAVGGGLVPKYARNRASRKLISVTVRAGGCRGAATGNAKGDFIRISLRNTEISLRRADEPTIYYYTKSVQKSKLCPRRELNPHLFLRTE